MNTFSYGNEDPNAIAAKMEEIVRRDLGLQTRVPFAVDAAEAMPASLASVAGDVMKHFLGGSTSLAFRVTFPIFTPRGALLTANVDRKLNIRFVATLTFVAHLRKPVGAELALEPPKLLGTPKFKGGAEAERLNAHKDLLKRCDAFARKEGVTGGGTLTIERACAVSPTAGGSVLMVRTLPHFTKMGLAVSTEAGEFLRIADAIEAAL